MTYQEWRHAHAFRIPQKALETLDRIMVGQSDQIAAAEEENGRLRDALNDALGNLNDLCDMKNAEIADLRAELAKPEQKPFFQFRECEDSQAGHPEQAIHPDNCIWRRNGHEACTTAQPAQEPATAVSLQCAHCQVTIEQLNDKVMYLMAQPAQEPLTDAHIAVLFEHKSGFTTKETYTNFARAIERAHDIGGKS